MKKFLIVFSGIIVSLLFCLDAKASHMMGADMVFKCLGNGKFEVTVKVYRDCNGVTITNVPVLITPLNCGSTGFTQAITQISITDITPVCSTVQSKCAGGAYQYGIEEYTYQGVIDLSSFTNCCKFKISWEQAARNGAITTGQQGENFYTEALLDKCISPCNSSPQITNRPIAIICAGQDFCFNNGILDSADGDSLSFELETPLQGAGVPCTYSTGFSKNSPLTFLGGQSNPNATLPAGFHLDPQTGDLCFRPIRVEIGVLVIKVTEWRKINGIATNIGETRRDMQIIVTTCPNNKVPNVQGPYAYNACANSKICFDMQSTDGDPADTVRLTWNKAIPNATFTTAFGTGGNSKKHRGTFCWTPTDDDVSSNPYYFTVSARDDACPINANTTKAYSITVNPMPRGTRKITKQKCGSVDFEITPVANYGTLSYQWKIKSGINVVGSSTNASFTHKFAVPGEYVIQSTLRTSKNCIMDYFDTLVVDTFATVTLPPDTFLCLGKSMTLNAQAAYGTKPYKYLWNTGAAGDTLPGLFVKPSLLSMYKVTITDSLGCVNSDSLIVDVKDLPAITLGADQRICSGEFTELDAGPDYQYLWSYQAATTQKLTITDSGSYSVRVIDTFGCINYDTMVLRVNSPVIINNIPDVSMCSGDSITLTGNGGDVYTWTNLSNLISVHSRVIKISPAQTLNYELIAERTYGGVTCMDIDSVKVTVNEATPVFFPPYADKCADVNTYQLNATPNSGFGGTGVFSCPTCPAGSVTGTNFNAAIAKQGDWNIHYTFTNSFGCVSKDSNNVTVHPLPIVDAGPLKRACLNAGPQKLIGILTNMSLQDGAESWKCTDCPTQTAITFVTGDGYYFDPAIAGLGSFKLIYEFISDEGCRSYDSATYQVLNIPVVNAGTLNQVCVTEPLFDLTTRAGATPAGGSWSGPGVVNVEFDAELAGAGTHSLIYSFIAAGCSKTDTVQILVNDLPDVSAGADQILCSNSPVYALSGIADGNTNPAGSRWYCADCPAGSDPVSGFNFNPAFVGSDSIKTYDLLFEYTSPVTGCVNSDPMSVTVRKMPTLSIEHRDALCQGSIFTVAGYYNGTNGIRWSSMNADTSGSNGFNCRTCPNTTYVPDNTLLSTYVVLTTNPIDACPSLSDTMFLQIFPTPVTSITVDNDSGCVPLSVFLTSVTDAGQGATYSWKLGDQTLATSTSSNTGHVYTQPGTWNASLEVTSIHGCTNAPAIQPIVVHPLPKAAFTYNPEYITVALPKVSFINKSNGASTYEWRFGDVENSTSDLMNPEFLYSSDTSTYTVEMAAITQYGCRDSVTGKVRINSDITVYVPNAFTPNNIGPLRNNRFYVDVEGVTSYSLMVFNRWGAILFRTNDRHEGWDGTFNNKPCQEDVYVYKIDVISYEGKPYTYNGTITLLR
jgi:gliding motility-associated-like protein